MNTPKQTERGASRQFTDEQASIAFAARYSDLVTDPVFSRSHPEGDAEKRSDQRAALAPHLERVARLLLLPEGRRASAVWEAKRQAVLAMFSEESPGSYVSALINADVDDAIMVEPTINAKLYTGPGQLDMVQTNSGVLDLANRNTSPVNLLKEGITYIGKRKQVPGARLVGPENYATLAKLSSDKGTDTLSDSEKKEYYDLINVTLKGFLDIAAKDAPNVIEMTNILSVIKGMPEHVVKSNYSAAILKHTLKILPEMKDRGLNLLVGAVAKLDLTDPVAGEVAAHTVNLALQKGKKFERSGDLALALDAVSNLPKGVATEQVFATLLDVRNTLEVVADLATLKSNGDKLRYIVENLIEDQSSSLIVQGMGEAMRKKAARICNEKLQAGGLTDQARADMQQKYLAIKRNADAL